jgi:hypothetical protein
METQPKTLGSFAMDTAREFCLSRSIALSKYGELLGRFGDGKVKPAEFSEGLVKVGLEDAVRYAHDAIKLGGTYVEFFSNLTRASVTDAVAEMSDLAKPKPGRTTKRSRSEPSRHRQTTAQKKKSK